MVEDNFHYLAIDQMHSNELSGKHNKLSSINLAWLAKKLELHYNQIILSSPA